jgi:hypothetical protein
VLAAAAAYGLGRVRGRRLLMFVVVTVIVKRVTGSAVPTTTAPSDRARPRRCRSASS